MNNLIGKQVETTLWGYMPSIDGEDVDKDCFGSIRGVVESVAPYNPEILVVKVKEFRRNYVGAEWTTDLEEIKNGRCFIGGPSHYNDGYLEEWYYNLKVLSND